MTETNATSIHTIRAMPEYAECMEEARLLVKRAMDGQFLSPKEEQEFAERFVVAAIEASTKPNP